MAPNMLLYKLDSPMAVWKEILRHDAHINVSLDAHLQSICVSVRHSLKMIFVLTCAHMRENVLTCAHMRENVLTENRKSTDKDQT